MSGEDVFDPTTFDAITYINEPRWQKSRYGLERIHELLTRLGNPQDSLRFVHVAGTNGKGSICAYLAETLKQAGYNTGLFTSPYIMVFEERIQVNGQIISSEDLKAVTLEVREHAEAMAAETGDHPTEFELMSAVAFTYFARRACDIAVVEVGLGGRLDSTNIIEAPEVCIIGRLGLEHTELLGDTLVEIAGEKAGIIKEGCPVVAWPQDDQAALAVVRDKASACHAPLIIPDFAQLEIGQIRDDGMRSFTYNGYGYTTKLLGNYQPFNAVCAIEALQVLADNGWDIPESTIERGIASTFWPARFEVVKPSSLDVTVVVDGGHNEQGAVALASSLADAFPQVRPVFLMGVLADKKYPGMIAAVLPRARAFVCVAPPNPRALAAHDLAQAIRDSLSETKLPLHTEGETLTAEDVYTAANFDEAAAKAIELAGPGGLICAFGSLYSVQAVRDAFHIEL